MELPISMGPLSATADDIRLDRSSSLTEEVVELFDGYSGSLFRYVHSFGINPQDSEDVVQEVFLALFRHLQMRRSRKNLRAWMFRVSHNLALKRRMYRQKQGNTVELDEALLESCASSGPNPEQDIVFRERQARLLAVVRALPEQEERCLRLRAEGLTYREIAAVLDISLGSVSIAVTRSLARLRRSDLG